MIFSMDVVSQVDITKFFLISFLKKTNSSTFILGNWSFIITLEKRPTPKYLIRLLMNFHIRIAFNSPSTFIEISNLSLTRYECCKFNLNLSLERKNGPFRFI